jgi:hypothetical protein
LVASHALGLVLEGVGVSVGDVRSEVHVQELLVEGQRLFLLFLRYGRGAWLVLLVLSHGRSTLVGDGVGLLAQVSLVGVVLVSGFFVLHWGFGLDELGAQFEEVFELVGGRGL